jgi:PTS system nitrogen regulatory IIA component
MEWITRDHLPCALVGGQYRFDPAELLEWAAVRRQPFDPSCFLDVDGELRPAATRLADALSIGGVVRDVDGADLREILAKALRGLPIPESFGIDALIELILMREELGSTAIGGGIGVPHPRRPVILATGAPVIRLCYLSRPLDMKGPDGIPVDKLFLMLCPTTHEHLQLLALLASSLTDKSFLAALNEGADTKSIVEAVRETGRRFDERPQGSGKRS